MKVEEELNKDSSLVRIIIQINTISQINTKIWMDRLGQGYVYI